MPTGVIFLFCLGAIDLYSYRTVYSVNGTACTYLTDQRREPPDAAVYSKRNISTTNQKNYMKINIKLEGIQEKL